MNSSFSSHYVQSLAISLVLPAASEARPTSKKQSLQSLVASTRQLLSYSDTRKALESLERIERDYTDAFSATHVDSEEYALKRAVIGKVVVCLYAEALDTYLSEASDAEAEAEWWADVERSRQNVAYYLLQTFPARVINLTRTILRTLQTRNIPLTPSIFTPSSLRRLFPTNNALRPNVLTTALFPHLKTHPHTVTLTYVSSEEPVAGGAKTANSILLWAQSILRIFTLPYELTTHECRIKRKELEKLRDERAEVLGALTNMRSELASALTEVPQGLHMDGFQMDDKLASFVDILCRVAVGELMSPATSPPLSYVSSQQDIVSKVQTLADVTLHTHKAQHANYLASRNLMRPSRLTLMWPRLLILPLLTAYLVREAYRSRASLAEMAKETGETIQNFFKDWLLEPIMDVVKTIRAGGEEGVIVRKEGVVADFNSLERMTLSLAQDKLNYSQDQLESLSKQIRVGDLTPILEIYEEDIKSPLKSAVSGTLLRSMFVQVQKAKVDIDQALAGIDKLLKSQELTFAFVGVAPAFAVVYVVSGYIRSLWSGGRGRGRYGGKRRRAGVWIAMRRIERLLIFQPRSTHHSERTPTSSAIPPLTSGLLLLSVTHLRNYAETCLPARSGLREGFLEDVQDLEDPVLGRSEKLRVVDRMWKSWGDVLGWGRVVG